MNRRLSGMIVSTLLTAAVALSSGAAALPASAEWKKESSGYSYRDENGERLKGWQTIKNKKYCFGRSGISYSGLKKVGRYYYYFIPEKRGQVAVGWQYIDGINYYFDENGRGASGFTELDGDTYYFDPKNEGQLSIGFMKIDGGLYYFKDDGVMMKGGWYFDLGNENSGENKLYYVEPSGKLAVGNVSINGRKYCFDKNGAFESGGTPYANSSLINNIEIGMSSEQVLQILGQSISDFRSVTLNGNTYNISVIKTEGKFLNTKKCYFTYVFVNDTLAGVVVDHNRNVRDAMREWDAAAEKMFYTRNVSNESGVEIKTYSDIRNIDPSRAFSFEYGGDAYFFITDAENEELFNAIKAYYM